MNTTIHRLVVGCALAAGCAYGADFGFSAVIQAGQPNNGDWELGIGPTGNNGAVNAHLNPYYPNNTARGFQISFNAASRTLSLRYYYTPTTFQTVSYTTPYVYAPDAELRWEIPASGLYVTAESRNRPTGVYVENLSLTGSGITVLQPLSVTNLTVTQNGGGASASMPSPVVFLATGSTNWTLSGTIRFQGLGQYVSGGARRDELRMGFSGAATIVQTPEPASALLIGAGLAVFATRKRKKTRGKERPGV